LASDDTISKGAKKGWVAEEQDKMRHCGYDGRNGESGHKEQENSGKTVYDNDDVTL
jgi:hypothetical protein